MNEAVRHVLAAQASLAEAMALLAEPDADPAAWFATALGELGVKEIPGDRDNPRIVEYHSVTTLAAEADETPWCSSFVCWCLERAGVAHTRDARARSYEDYGDALTAPIRGCIVVLSRGTNPRHGHVAFLDRVDGDGLILLGGNQGNAVSRKRYPRSRVVAYRWPDLDAA